MQSRYLYIHLSKRAEVGSCGHTSTYGLLKLTETSFPFMVHFLRNSPSLGLCVVPSTKWPVLNRMNRDVFPTPTSPTSTTLSGGDSIKFTSEISPAILETRFPISRAKPHLVRTSSGVCARGTMNDAHAQSGITGSALRSSNTHKNPSFAAAGSLCAP